MLYHHSHHAKEPPGGRLFCMAAQARPHEVFDRLQEPNPFGLGSLSLLYSVNSPSEMTILSSR